MSIKNLFNKKPASFQNATSGSSLAESAEFIIQKSNQKETFIPNIDFSSASNLSSIPP